MTGPSPLDARRFFAGRWQGRGELIPHGPARLVLRRAPVVLVVCVDLRLVAALDKELDRNGVVAGASVYPLVWNVLLAARNEGFGGTITTMAIAEEPALKRLLGIPEPFAVAAVVPLGKPVRQLKRLRRVPVAEMTHYGHWNGGPLQI